MLFIPPEQNSISQINRSGRASQVVRLDSMDSDQGKLFIGGISWETTEEKLKEYFENYGEVSQTVVMKDKATGRPRGFGFVVFLDPSLLDRVLLDKHVIDGRTVEAKRALSRDEQQVSRGSFPNAIRGNGSGGDVRTKKIFVGGLPPTLSEEGFREYFEAFGNVTDVVIMYDQNTQRPRGFGFISFDIEDAVDRVLETTFHDLNGKQVEVKRALPKDANTGGGSRTMGGSAGPRGGYQGYSASSGIPTYDGGMNSNRYLQSPNTGGVFPPYGSSGYNAAGYGYGPSSNGMGFGSYGAFPGGNAGYSSSGGAAYGNPSLPSSGYAGGLHGASRSSYGNQGPAAYGAAGYGNAASWGAPGSGSVVSAGGQGYGGYGGYGGGDGSYASGGSYGSAPNSNSGIGGAELQGAGGYTGSGYNDSNGNAGWGSDPSQGSYGSQSYAAQAGYANGYSGAQSRQAQ